MGWQENNELEMKTEGPNLTYSKRESSKVFLRVQNMCQNIRFFLQFPLFFRFTFVLTFCFIFESDIKMKTSILLSICVVTTLCFVVEVASQNYAPPKPYADAPQYGQLGCCRSNFPGKIHFLNVR